MAQLYVSVIFKNQLLLLSALTDSTGDYLLLQIFSGGV